MKRLILIIFLMTLCVSYAESIPVIIEGKDFKGEKIKDFIFVFDKDLVIYKDKTYGLKKIEDLYISEGLGILYDGKDVFNIYVLKDFIFSPEKEIVIKDGRKYNTKKIGKIYFAITKYNYNLEGFKVFAYGINPRLRYTLLELCIFNYDEKPIILQQNMFKVSLGNIFYFPDSASSIYLSSEGKEVLFRKLLNPKEGVVAYLTFDLHGVPDKLIIDLNFGLEKPIEIKLP